MKAASKPVDNKHFSTKILFGGHNYMVNDVTYSGNQTRFFLNNDYREKKI